METMKKKKNYNTVGYRNAKRVVAFVAPKLKKEIVKQARLEKRSISKEISEALRMYYLWE
jgi:hypothetical protein